MARVTKKSPAKAAAIAVDGDAQAESAAAGSVAVNGTLYKQLADNVATVMDHKLFKKIESHAPLAVDKGGHQAPYNEDDFLVSIKENGMHKCGFNLFMLNLSWSPTPGVPLADMRVDTFIDYYFKKAAPLPLDLVIRVPSATDFNPMKHVGDLQCITPEEVKMAFLKALARDIANGATEATLKEWRSFALSATAVFKVMESEDDVFFQALNFREKLVTNFHTLARTAFQRNREVAHFRQRKLAAWGHTAPNKRIVEEFNNRAEIFDKSEQVNVDYVQKALVVCEKAFSLPSVVQSIGKLEGVCKKYSPYDSIHKLAGIVRRAKDTPVIIWVFATITDLVVSKKYHGLDFPARWLLGDPNTGRGGAVDLFIMKHRMLEYLISTQLDTFAFPSHVKEKMREVLANHDNYRKLLNPIVKSDDAPRACNDAQSACVVAEPKPDLTWRRNWSRSAIMYLSFVERCCYGDDFDTSLRTASKMGKSALDVLQYESITLAMKDVHDMQTREQEEERKTLCLSGAGPDQATGVAVDPVAAGADPATPSAAVGGQQGNSLDQRLQLEAERMVNSKFTWRFEPECVLEVKTAIMSSNAGRSEGRDGLQYVLFSLRLQASVRTEDKPGNSSCTSTGQPYVQMHRRRHRCEEDQHGP